MDETDSSIQIYHPIFSNDNYETIVALEIVLQLVFDHAKLQLPEEVRPRVIQCWQFRGHGDNLNSSGQRLHGLVHCHARDPPARAVSGGVTKRSRRS